MSSIIIQKVQNSLFDSCTYVLSMGTSVCWIVDCGDVEPLVPLLKNKHLNGVLLTHAHFDHIYGLNKLLEYFPGLIVYTNRTGYEALLNDKLNLSKYHETPFVFEEPKLIRIITDGDEIELDKGVTAKVIATPGHHPSCLSYIVGDAFFTGDSYIPGTKVVTNLPKGNKGQSLESLNKIMQLSNNFTVYPGHFIEKNLAMLGSYE